MEGSHDAVIQSLLSTSEIVEHDFSRGPWWYVISFRYSDRNALILPVLVM